jgi:hypothetical protein
MITDNERITAVKDWILNRLTEHGTEVSFTPQQIFQGMYKTSLAESPISHYVSKLPEALLSLIWEGRLVVTGPWRVRLPAPAEVKVKPPELARLEAARADVVRKAKVVVHDGWDERDELMRAVHELEEAEDGYWKNEDVKL